MHHFTCQLHDFPSDLGDFTPFREGHARFHFAALRAAMHHFNSDAFHYTRDQLYSHHSKLSRIQNRSPEKHRLVPPRNNRIPLAIPEP